jgi:hypothetical protein
MAVMIFMIFCRGIFYKAWVRFISVIPSVEVTAVLVFAMIAVAIAFLDEDIKTENLASFLPILSI